MIYVIIPVHNRIQFTLRCLDSVYKQDIKDDLTVVVVDDGSTDFTKIAIERNYSSVAVLEGDGNLFWTGGVKVGVDYALSASSSGEDWIILMNNDVVLPSSQVFNSLIKFAQQLSSPSLVAPLSISKNDKQTMITSGTKVKSWILNLTQHVFNGGSYEELKTLDPQPVDFMTARCLLHPIKIFTEIGNYDYRNFPHYGGDDEFSHRAKKNGYLLYILTSLVVYLDDNDGQQGCARKFFAIGSCLFGIRSSINLRDKFVFASRVPPPYARISFFLVAALKTLLGCLKG